MKIEWNKVTWYSKAIATGFFLAVLFGGFWAGLEFGYLGGYVDGVLRIASLQGPIPQLVAATDPYYENTATWQTITSTAGGFSIAYPLDFPTGGGAAVPSADWRVNTPQGETGILYFSLMIPKAFEPQTNFDDAKLTVGASRNATAVDDCLLADQSGGPMQATSTTMINGASFTAFHSSGAGAGNLYETTSYRVLRAGQCFAVEYTIHSSQIANYPAEYHLKPLDETKLTDVLDRIVGTFSFSR
jgi:hypothetical protein